MPTCAVHRFVSRFIRSVIIRAGMSLKFINVKVSMSFENECIAADICPYIVRKSTARSYDDECHMRTSSFPITRCVPSYVTERYVQNVLDRVAILSQA